MRRPMLFALPLAALLSSCREVQAPPDRVTTLAPVENALVAPAPDTDGVLRVLVLHDMEGLSGQDDPRTFSYRYGEHYARGREYLVGDVNAVIAGLFDAGADEVHVVDGHGSGNPEPDILLDVLDDRARMVFRDEPFRQYVDLVEPGVYDAVAVVGMHAKTGSGGFASHTYTLGIEIRMNGEPITETELVGFSFGRVDVPVIFASGDDRLAADLATIPWIEYVTVKTATSASTAELRPVDEVRRELREAASRALANREQARAMKIGLPVRAAVHTVPPASLQVLEGVPGIEYDSETVSFTAESFQEAYDGVVELIGVATTSYPRVLTETLREHPDGETILFDYSDRLFDRWFDYESGRWPPEAPPPEPSRAGARYHGAR